MANYGMEEPRKRNVRAEMNITPMVDIVFTLLIIFMVAAPLIEQGVDLDLPQTETVPIESPKDKFIVRVFDGKKESENQIFIDKTEVPLKELEVKLKTNAFLQEKKEIYLHASRNLSYGYVVRIMAIMKKAGVNNINLVTEPLEKE
ncbi:biopolymer transporter ExbD [bacterium]|nr:biopolymer transporter ExbD [bacterium]MBQ4438743.1 biopolymer transporter ExbD [bacterium]